MLVVLDEGRAIARARDEIWVGTEDALAAMSQSGVSTAGLLQKRGITPRALTPSWPMRPWPGRPPPATWWPWPATASSSRSTFGRICCATCSTC